MKIHLINIGLKISELFQYFNENLLLPIILSIIAAIIFWLVFNYFPEKRKFKKIRPKIEFDLFQIHFELVFYFFKLYQISPFRSVENQHKIEAGCLTKNEIELWLQNKCLNDTYKYDSNSNKLIPIGEELKRIALKYSERLQKLLNFVDYLSVNEILLLQKIEYILFTYDYESEAVLIVGNTKHYPINPNIAYMSENIFELYQLYIELRKTILDYKLIDRDINKYLLPNFEIMKATDFYYCGEYKKCLRYLKGKKSKERNWLIFQCQLKLAKNAVAYNMLRELLNSSKTELVSLRGYLSPFILDNDEVGNICKEIRGEGEFKYCLKVVKEIIALREYYEKQNIELKQFYETKLNENISIGKEKHEKDEE